MNVAMTRSRACALLFGSAALSSSTCASRAQTIQTLRIAIVPVENQAEAYYANDLGLFAKVGIQVDIQAIQNTGAVAAAVVSRAVDIGAGAVDALAAAHERNIPITVIAPAAEYVTSTTQGIAALVVPANSTVQQASDLNNKIIATSGLHSLAEDAPRVWLDQHGGDSSTVKFIEIPFPAMPAALEAGRVDAAFVTEPFLALARKSGRVIAYCYDAISPHFLITAWFTTVQWATKYPDLIKRFASVIRETNIWANNNPTQSGEMLAQHTKIEPSVIATMVRAHYAEQLTPALLQPLIDVSAKYNGFKSFPAQELLYAT